MLLCIHNYVYKYSYPSLTAKRIVKVYICTKCGKRNER